MSKHRQEPPRHAGNKPAGARRATNKPEAPPQAPAPRPAPKPVAAQPPAPKPTAPKPPKQAKPVKQAKPAKPPREPKAPRAAKPARVSSAPAARYGEPTNSRMFLIIGGVIGAVFLLWLVWAVVLHSTPKVTAGLTSYEFGDHLAIAHVDVKIDKGVLADCTVEAIAEDHSIVGVQHFSPVNGTNTVQFRIDRAGTSVTLVGCTVLDRNSG